MTFVSFVRYHVQVLVKRYNLNKPITHQQQFHTFNHANAVKHQNGEEVGVKWPWTWRIWFVGGSVGIFTTSPRTSLSFTKNHSKKRKFPGEQQLWGGNCLANVRGQRSDHNKGDRKWPNCWFQATQHLCSVKTRVQTLNIWLLLIIATSIMSVASCFTKSFYQSYFKCSTEKAPVLITQSFHGCLPRKYQRTQT